VTASAFAARACLGAISFLVVAAPACTRGASVENAEGGLDAASSVAARDVPPSDVRSAAPVPESILEREAPPLLFGAPGFGLEARRSVVTRVEADPILSANIEALRKQHAGASPASLAVQATELGADRRRLVLAAAERKNGTVEKPMILVVDERGSLVWANDRPTAGITPPIGPIAIAAGPHGRFALAACDPPSSSVALRLWDADGSPFADFQALETKACDAITLLYWPGHGWLIAIAAGSETRVQRVTETGGLAWGPGRVLGARFRTAAPASLGADSSSSFLLVQYSQSPGIDRGVDHAIAFRYDECGRALWPTPTDLGAVRRVAPGQERIALSRTGDGVMRAALAGGSTVEIRSNGETRRVP
jgi:hypothetical protein